MKKKNYLKFYVNFNTSYDNQYEKQVETCPEKIEIIKMTRQKPSRHIINFQCYMLSQKKPKIATTEQILKIKNQNP